MHDLEEGLTIFVGVFCGFEKVDRLLDFRKCVVTAISWCIWMEMGARFSDDLHIEAVVGGLDSLFGTSLVDRYTMGLECFVTLN